MEVERGSARVPTPEPGPRQEGGDSLGPGLSDYRIYNARHPEDYTMEMPQSGERFRGRENMRNFQEAYNLCPPPSIRLRRVLVREGLWVVEGVIGYGGGQVFDVVVIISELEDGKMWRDRWYFAEPFEAPKWRAQ